MTEEKSEQSQVGDILRTVAADERQTRERLHAARERVYQAKIALGAAESDVSALERINESQQTFLRDLFDHFKVASPVTPPAAPVDGSPDQPTEGSDRE